MSLTAFGNSERVDDQEEENDKLKNEQFKEENYYLKKKLDNKRDIIKDKEIELEV